MPKDWETLGYLAFPSNRHYPKPEENKIVDFFKFEAQYLQGWNRAKREREIARQNPGEE